MEALQDDDGSVKIEFVNPDSLDGYLYAIGKLVGTQAARSLRVLLWRLDPSIRRNTAQWSSSIVSDDDPVIFSIAWAVIKEKYGLEERPRFWDRVPGDASIIYDMLHRAIKLKVKDIVKGESGLAFTDAYYAQKEAIVGHDHVAEPPSWAVAALPDP
jgi:hypothetical protein